MKISNGFIYLSDGLGISVLGQGRRQSAGLGGCDLDVVSTTDNNNSSSRGDLPRLRWAHSPAVGHTQVFNGLLQLGSLDDQARGGGVRDVGGGAERPFGLDDDDGARPLVPALGLAAYSTVTGSTASFASLHFQEASAFGYTLLSTRTTPWPWPITLRRHPIRHTAELGYAGAAPDYVRRAKQVNRNPEEELRGTLAAWETPLKFPWGSWVVLWVSDWAGQDVKAVSRRTLASLHGGGPVLGLWAWRSGVVLNP
ncbi:hypothetical protein DHEL01_v201623 [Diaporthe helianthi]|uniref:Uncharacterized protein n=1 Tax=Diaporthe helianthi TaxID=158607 RepID=A0A2P5IBU3_DIAHE|nr:hypothetical protein DHEL01_v201623 [Diaporthe helianthi]